MLTIVQLIVKLQPMLFMLFFNFALLRRFFEFLSIFNLVCILLSLVPKHLFKLDSGGKWLQNVTMVSKLF